jgi:hypothetical protein
LTLLRRVEPGGCPPGTPTPFFEPYESLNVLTVKGKTLVDILESVEGSAIGLVEQRIQVYSSFVWKVLESPRLGVVNGFCGLMASSSD